MLEVSDLRGRLRIEAGAQGSCGTYEAMVLSGLLAVWGDGHRARAGRRVRPASPVDRARSCVGWPYRGAAAGVDRATQDHVVPDDRVRRGRRRGAVVLAARRDRDDLDVGRPTSAASGNSPRSPQAGRASSTTYAASYASRRARRVRAGRTRRWCSPACSPSGATGPERSQPSSAAYGASGVLGLAWGGRTATQLRTAIERSPRRRPTTTPCLGRGRRQRTVAASGCFIEIETT